MKTILRNQQTLELRIAQPADAKCVLTYIEQVSGESTFLTFGPGEFSMTEAQEADYFRLSQQRPNWVYLLGFVDGDLVTTANITASDRSRLQHCGVLGMSVKRAFWGNGIGGAVLDHCVLWARTNPILSKLDLKVRTDNTRAIALYRGRGFVEEGILRKQLLVDGVYCDLMAMGLDVSTPQHGQPTIW